MTDRWPLFWVKPSAFQLETVSAYAFRQAPCPAARHGLASCMAELVVQRSPVEGPALTYQQLSESFPLLKACAACGRAVDSTWSFSTGRRRLWFRPEAPDDLREHPEDFGPGAVHEADWLARFAHSWWDDWPEGKAPIVIQTPGGGWMPESRANNCTLKDDRLHRCWVLHGEGLNLTADKNGRTCSAGAGSILSGGWHGWLSNGILHE